MTSHFEHNDRFAPLTRKSSFSQKLGLIHALLKQKFPFVHRIAVAKYEYVDDMLDTYAFSCTDGSPLNQYSAKLSDVSSLVEVLDRRKPRLVSDMSEFSHSSQPHSSALLKAGYQSSYTHPIIWGEKFYGFLFFDAHEPNAFSEAVLEELDIIAHLVMLSVVNEWSGIDILKATLRSAHHMSGHRDPETGSHLSRMSHYARMIARKLTDKHDIDDEYIEHIFLFSPLHDLGKIAIPDAILHKQHKLSTSEYEIMKTHVIKGAEMVDELLNNYNLGDMNFSQMLQSITKLHHETLDGKGYPYGLNGEDIPLEARIVAVADVFDALSSKRPYKPGMANEEAFQIMRQLAGSKLDVDCVNALLDSADEIKVIQAKADDNQDRTWHM